MGSDAAASILRADPEKPGRQERPHHFAPATDRRHVYRA